MERNGLGVMACVVMGLFVRLHAQEITDPQRHELQTVRFVNFQTGGVEATYSYSDQFIDAETGRVRATVQYVITTKGRIG